MLLHRRRRSRSRNRVRSLAAAATTHTAPHDQGGEDGEDDDDDSDDDADYRAGAHAGVGGRVGVRDGGRGVCVGLDGHIADWRSSDAACCRAGEAAVAAEDLIRCGDADRPEGGENLAAKSGEVVLSKKLY